MRKLFFAFSMCMLGLLVYSCSDDEQPGYDLSQVKIQLVYPEGSGCSATEGVEVSLKSTSTGTVFSEKTDASGVAQFQVPRGIYEASASEQRVMDVEVYLFNGINSQVNASTEQVEAVIRLEMSKGGSVVIKELYVGGCPKDDGSGYFARDQYVILYNNSSATIDISDLALAMVNPFNSQASNKDYVNGQLFYAAEGWIPAGNGFWYFESPVTLEPGKQVVISMCGSVDNTKTYSQSINFANKDYYCCYDVEDYSHPAYYPTPSELIPTSHYLKVYSYGLGTAWPLSNSSPAFYLVRPQGTSLKEFVDNPANENMYGSNQVRRKVPVEWVVDGVEVFAKGQANNKKRLVPSIDAGYVEMTAKMGYTLYRNVDKEATEAVPGNEGKLVYSYALGVDGATDPSGIDAEASIRKGARIVYKDTNNSSQDFHLRSKASLRN